MKYEYSEQKGVPNHCFCAQVFKPDGKSLLTIEPTDNPEEATMIAKIIADALNMNQTIDVSIIPTYVKSVENIMHNAAIQHLVSKVDDNSLLKENYTKFIETLRKLKRIEE